MGGMVGGMSGGGLSGGGGVGGGGKGLPMLDEALLAPQGQASLPSVSQRGKILDCAAGQHMPPRSQERKRIPKRSSIGVRMYVGARAVWRMLVFQHLPMLSRYIGKDGTSKAARRALARHLSGTSAHFERQVEQGSPLGK